MLPGCRRVPAYGCFFFAEPWPAVLLGTLVIMADGWMWEPPEPRELPALRESLADQMRSPHEHQALVSLLHLGR